MDIKKVTEILTLIFEIVFFIGALISLTVGIIFLCNKGLATDYVKNFNMTEHIFSVGSFSLATANMTVDDAAGSISVATLMSALLFAAFGMIFRNVNLIVRTMEGRTWFSSGETPFQDDVIRMIREIGIFSIFISLFSLVMTWVIKGIYHSAECSASLLPILFGIIIICLSEIFRYGMKLQETEDGII